MLEHMTTVRGQSDCCSDLIIEIGLFEKLTGVSASDGLISFIIYLDIVTSLPQGYSSTQSRNACADDSHRKLVWLRYIAHDVYRC